MPVTTIRGGRQITDGTIPYVDIQNVTASRLVGNPTSSAATMSEISLGTGLAFSGTSIVVSTNLQSLSGLTYSSASFVKMTAAGTFALDTNVYLTAETDTLATVTGRGATTSSAISITNTTNAVSASTGALIISGGIGVATNIWAGGSITTGGFTMGQGMTNQNIYLTIQNPGIGYANGFSFVRGTDGAGIKVIETGTDATMYEFWMSDNPDGGDMMQWRWDDWQNVNGMTVPIQSIGRSNRYVADGHSFYGAIIQNTASFYTTSNVSGTNGSDKQLLINTVSKLRNVGSTVDITAFDVSGYTGNSGDLFWIKLDTTTTFAWGYGSTAGTATVTGVSLSTSQITLSNGIKVTFSATTGTVGDLFAARVYKVTANVFGTTTVTGTITATTIAKSGGTSSQFLKADGSVDSSSYYLASNPNGYTTNPGTVTSVALSLPAIFSVSGSPVTTSGTLSATLATQTANTIFAGPTTGTAAAPTFRTLVVADIPTLNQNTTGSSGSVVNSLTAGTGLSGSTFNGSAAVTWTLAAGYGDSINPYASKTANYVLAAPNGAAGVPTFRALVAADIPTLNQNTTGSAGSVTSSLVLKADSGNTEGTDLYTFNGSAAKTLNFIGGTNITITKAAGSWTITNGITNLNQLTNGPGYITGYTETDTLATVISRGNTTLGTRPIVLDNSGGAVFIQGDSGGWATGLYFKGSAGTIRGAYGALGSGDTLTNLWIGTAYNATWITFTSSAVNSQVALQQSGNQVLHAGNYTSYSPSLTGSGASGTWGINVTGYSANLYGGSTIQSTSTGTVYTSNYQVRENVGGSGNTSETYAPQLAFHWGNVVASSIMLESSGRIAIRNNPGTSYEAFAAGSITSYGNIYAVGNILMSNATSPYTYYLQFGDNTGWAFRFMTNVAGTPTTRFTFADNGTFTAVGDVIAYSDARVKTNVQTIDNALEKVISMRGVTYTRTDTADKSEKVGVIAQEMQKVLPQVVTEDKEGILGVSYGNLAGVFIEAFKEQQKKIEDLEKQIKLLVENSK